jgi:hypothetical protein
MDKRFFKTLKKFVFSCLKMKNLLLITFFLLTSSVLRAHEFYFSFAEMEYNTISERYELTLIVTTHDLEKALEETGQGIENMLSLSTDEIVALEEYVNQHLNIACGFERSVFSYLGNEVSLNGTTELFFESAPLPMADNFIEVRYSVLMDHFPEQQNKLTFYYMGETYTAAFTPFKKTQTIRFENKEE